MKTLLATAGLHPDEAGRIIVAQAAEGRFWIATHPQMLQASADARARHLQDRIEPSMKPEAAAILGDPPAAP